MSKTCERCRFYRNQAGQPFAAGTCVMGRLYAALVYAGRIRKIDDYPAIDAAREICDREGDGVFVYFEPSYPQAGAAFMQITREPKKLAAAGASR